MSDAGEHGKRRWRFHFADQTWIDVEGDVPPFMERVAMPVNGWYMVGLDGDSWRTAVNMSCVTYVEELA